MAIDFTIVYNPRVSNKVVASLSCHNHDELQMKTLISTKSIDWDLLQNKVNRDATLVHIRHTTLEDGETPLGFTLYHAKLFYKGCFVLAKSSPFIRVGISRLS